MAERGLSAASRPVADTPPLGALIQWFPDKKGLASGLVICGFGGAGLVFTQLVNMGTDHFQKLPTFAGLPGSLETTIESGRMLATVDGQQTEVVLATQADLAKLTTDLAEGYYVVGSGDTGAAATLAVLGTGYLATMLASSFLMRRPHPTYVPAGYTPPEPAAAGATDKENGYIIPAGQNVPLGAGLSASGPACGRWNVSSTDSLLPGGLLPVPSVMKTPQFWLMSGTFFSLATGGMALASVAKPLMADVFTGALPGVVTAGFGSLYLQMMMGSNLGGRLGWAAISDQIGRRNTFLIFTAASVPCYAMLPTLTSTVIDTGSAVPLYGFIGASLFATTMMGGTYALMPAYEADLFGAKVPPAPRCSANTSAPPALLRPVLPGRPSADGTLRPSQYVGPIHGRFLLFGAGASGMVGPEVVKKLRGDSEAAEMEKLLGQVDPAKFNDLFGVGMDKAEELVQAKTLTIAKLMTIAPEGLPDPSPFIYDSVRSLPPPAPPAPPPNCRPLPCAARSGIPVVFPALRPQDNPVTVVGLLGVADHRRCTRWLGS